MNNNLLECISNYLVKKRKNVSIYDLKNEISKLDINNPKRSIFLNQFIKIQEAQNLLDKETDILYGLIIDMYEE